MSLQTLKVVIARPFYFQRSLLALGETVELPKVFAQEMCAAHKATIAPEVKPVAGGEAVDDAVQTRGGKHAGK